MRDDLALRLERIRTELERRTRMNPCLPESDVQAFELRWGIDLPLGYRQFIVTVGDGGIGPPEYRLLPLGEVPPDYDYSAEEVLADACKPFPLEQGWVWEGDQEPKPQLQSATRHGNLILGTDGCARYWLLIVTGPQRGQIWFRADVGIIPCDPPRDFLGWYEHWLAGGREWFEGKGE